MRRFLTVLMCFSGAFAAAQMPKEAFTRQRPAQILPQVPGDPYVRVEYFKPDENNIELVDRKFKPNNSNGLNPDFFATTENAVVDALKIYEHVDVREVSINPKTIIQTPSEITADIRFNVMYKLKDIAMSATIIVSGKIRYQINNGMFNVRTIDIDSIRDKSSGFGAAGQAIQGIIRGFAEGQAAGISMADPRPGAQGLGVQQPASLNAQVERLAIISKESLADFLSMPTMLAQQNALMFPTTAPPRP